jgi:hypothetical protein
MYNGRNWSNEQLKKLSKNLPEFRNAINVSGHLDSDKDGGFYRNYFKSNFYKISSYQLDGAYSNPNSQILLDLDSDISQINANDRGMYDLIFSHTVLEHVRNPFQAFSNLEALLSEDGIIISVVPFIYKFHFSAGNFGDYWRYTPHTLQLLHKHCGLSTNLLLVGPERGFEKYIISIGSRNKIISKIDFDEDIIDEWNQSVGNSSIRSQIHYLISRVLEVANAKSIF